MPQRQHIVKAALVGATCSWLAFAAFSDAAGGVFAAVGSPKALTFDGRNGIALAQHATALIEMADGDRMKAPQALAAAKLAVAEAPLQSSAMRSLAFATALSGNELSASRQLRMAEWLSRRDLATQLALIEQCVLAQDVSCALRHYDVALTASRRSSPLLSRTLTDALAVPEVRTGVANYLRAERPWVPEFLAYAAINSADPAPIAEAIVAAGSIPENALVHESEGIILGRLAGAGQWTPYRRFYDSLEGRGASGALTLSFMPALVDIRRRPFAWRQTATGPVNVVFEPTGRRSSRMRAVVESGSNDVAVDKVIFAAPGKYRIATRFSLASFSDGGGASWRLRCIEGAAAGRVVAEQAPHMPTIGTSVWSVAVPDDCMPQQIELRLSGGNGEPGGELVIDDVTMQKAGSR